MGNLLIADEAQRHFPPDAHPHVWCRYISKKYNMGKFFYVDLWPFGPRWLFVTDPEVASQYVTTTQSLLKSPLEVEYLDKLVGKGNLVCVEGSQWKALRSMFNPGFATSHLMTLVPYIVVSSLTFCEAIKEKARTTELFEMEEYATRLTVDIIGKVVLYVTPLPSATLQHLTPSLATRTSTPS